MAGIMGFLKNLQTKLEENQTSQEKKLEDIKTKRLQAERKLTENRSKAKNTSPQKTPASVEPSQCGTDQAYLPKVGKTHRVVGLNYRQENVMKLASENPNYKLTKDQIIKRRLTDTHIHRYLFTNSPVTLEQEPSSPHDPNAIKVIVAGQHIGYIKAGSCAHLNKVINEGRIEQVLCRIYGGPSVCVYTTADADNEKPRLQMEKNNTDFHAEIRVVEKTVK